MKLLGSLAVLFTFVLTAGASTAAADSDPVFERVFGPAVAGGTGFQNCTVATACVPGVGGPGAGENSQVSDVLFDAHGGMLVTDYLNYRINRYEVAADGSVSFDRTFGYGVQDGAPPAFQNCVADCRSGEAGGEAGALNIGWKMTLDGQDRLLVTEYSNDRVSRFLIAPDGTVTFDRAFGYDVNPTGGTGGLETCTAATTCQPGQAAPDHDAGELGGPDGIVVDDAGGIVVGEYDNHRVTRFTVATDGLPAFDRAFGLDVIPDGSAGFENCTIATGCGIGTEGDEAGAIKDNYSLEIAPDGRIFAAAVLLNRIDVFVRDTDGNFSFRQAVGADVIPGGGTGFETCTTDTGCQAGSGNGTGGSFDGSNSAGFDPATGGLFVTSEYDGRLTHLKPTADGGFAFDYAYGNGVAGGDGPQVCRTDCTIGTTGGEGGEFNFPEDAEVRGNRLYVAEFENRRVQVLNIGPAVKVTKNLAPAGDSGRFDLKVGDEVVAAGAGDGVSGSTRVSAGSAVSVSEVAIPGGPGLDLYDSSVDCGAGATTGSSITLQNLTADVSCLITNTLKGPGPGPGPTPSKARFSKLVLKPKKKKVKAGKKVKLTVKVTNTGGTKGTATVQIRSNSKKKASAPKKVKVTVPAGRTVSKKFTVRTKKRKRGKVTIKAKLGKRTAKTVLRLRK